MSLEVASRLQRPFLCPRCTDVLLRADERPLPNWSNYQVGTLEDLIASTRINCRLCKLFWANASVAILRRLFHADRDHADPEGRNTHRLSCGLLFDTNHGLFKSLHLEFEYFQLHPLSSEEVTLSSPLLPSHSSSDKSWAQAIQWYNTCIKSHKKCGSSPKLPQTLPTRLIDVGSHHAQEPRLIASNELSNQAQLPHYVTLSHSWGSGVPLKLLKGNFEEFRRRIPSEKLSETFRDAILVTRKLGIRYLWIDSLCIFQDCADDWRHESALMRDVYKGCICNIAATASSNFSTGLFVTRDPFAISPFAVEVARENHEQWYLCIPAAVRYDNLVKTNLNRRGWVFQERLLSPRTIHFSTQIFWECKELEASESYPLGLPDQYIRDTEVGNGPMFSFQGKTWSDDVSLNLESRDQVWRSIVETYTCCALSNERDKLVALSGVVKELQPVMDDEYVSGLWKKNLVCGLAWRVLDSKRADGTNAYRPTQYRAPTWSWASVVGRVLYEVIFEPYSLIKVIEAHVIPLTGDLTGEIVNGWLKIEAMIKPLPAITSSERAWKNKMKLNVDDGLYIDTPNEKSREGIFIVPLLRDGPLYPSARYNCRVFGLLLRLVEGENSTFRRVGLSNNWIFASSPDLKVDILRKNLGWSTLPQSITII